MTPQHKSQELVLKTCVQHQSAPCNALIQSHFYGCTQRVSTLHSLVIQVHFYEIRLRLNVIGDDTCTREDLGMSRSFAIGLFCAAAMAIAGCAQQTTTAKPAPTISAEAAKTAAVTARGTFVGKSNHVTTGHASIALVDKQWVVILEDDFTFDGAPDPHVALGSGGYRKDAKLALLSSNNGKQVYAIPANLDVADFNEIWIWCVKFAVPLGVAELTLT
jgi:hypothetical protein